MSVGALITLQSMLCPFVRDWPSLVGHLISATPKILDTRDVNRNNFESAVKHMPFRLVPLNAVLWTVVYITE